MYYRQAENKQKTIKQKTVIACFHNRNEKGLSYPQLSFFCLNKIQHDDIISTLAEFLLNKGKGEKIEGLQENRRTTYIIKTN